MKAIIHKNKTTAPKLTFPILMQFTDRIPKGLVLVVLFTGPTTGIVVASNTGSRSVGDMDSDWVDANNTSTWKVFEGSVEISN